MQPQEHIALAPYTTFKIGGPARYFFSIKTCEEIKECITFAKNNDVPVLVLGGGSNILIPDEGFDGVVIKIESEYPRSFETLERGETEIEVTAEAGESWDDLVLFCVKHKLWGVENLSGIPGSVGGAVVQNIGAYGAALSQTLHTVEVFDTKEDKIRMLSVEECQYGYRSSVFKQEEGRYIVLRATFLLSKQECPNLSYKDLAQRFAGQVPGLQEIRASLLEIRRAKFPDLSVEGTAGSFFKNPIMSERDAAVLKDTYPEMPVFPMPETSGIKIPLAWLLDKALSLHGLRVGGARLFEKQILVVAASRGTSARDVQELASLVQKKVFETLKIKIEPEVKII